MSMNMYIKRKTNVANYKHLGTLMEALWSFNVSSALCSFNFLIKGKRKENRRMKEGKKKAWREEGRGSVKGRPWPCTSPLQPPRSDQLNPCPSKL